MSVVTLVLFYAGFLLFALYKNHHEVLQLNYYDYDKTPDYRLQQLIIKNYIVFFLN